MGAQCTSAAYRGHSSGTPEEHGTLPGSRAGSSSVTDRRARE
jgi:hypothetical protein